MSLPVLRLPKRVYPRMPKRLPLIDQYPLYALSYDGTGYVLVTDSPSLNLGLDHTILMWAKTSSIIQGYLVSKSIVTRYEVELRFQATGQIRDQIYDGTNVITVLSPLSYNDGLLHRVGIVRDAGSFLQLYVDGILVNSSVDTCGNTYSGNNLGIGVCVRVGFSTFFNGINTLPCVYNRVLSLAEIQRDIYNPLDPVRNGLVLFHPLIEGQGIIVVDYSGQGNNGALAGGVTWSELQKYEIP